ncbi:MAG TPA: hypothetical protein DCS59_04425 [Eubacterium sp.]|nr:hypothetical protein [Eubacterium sp.]
MSAPPGGWILPAGPELGFRVILTTGYADKMFGIGSFFVVFLENSCEQCVRHMKSSPLHGQ